MNAIAIDDEPEALKIIELFSLKVPSLAFKKSFSDPVQAIDYLQKETVELLFLDVDMPDLSGLELLATISVQPLVIFTTAHSHYAVESYEFNTIDYLLKPFSFSRFLKSCQKAFEVYQLKKAPYKTDSENNYLFIKSGYQQIKVFYEEILFLESAGNYLIINLANNRKIPTRLTTVEALEILPSRLFVQIHRSYIVARNKIEKLDKYDVTVAGIPLPIGANYKNSIL
ncbi:LytTR family DNA-binding domain-containing protein [Xanthocytophaga agilis]|uniref:LytTR family DNA-binding domain-containing protein n=1 Tax=Xanthocytophaga agilis TaxID=3048010 RepID=A0AAE3RCC6_9BACT|nr:LytTR family DNA-binding domain-containing protein [Xanthocytophaga agilis]MDJ1505765.1 LytTR family DNA-binding domain-containing protein [Xanthocytophaga agilis]